MPLPKLLAIQIGNSLFNGLIGNTKDERKAMIGEYKSKLPDSDSYTVLERIQSDALYRMRSIRAAEIHSDTSNAKTYMYQFEYETKGIKGAFGAFHGFDAAFMFNNLSTLGACLGEESDVAEAQALARQHQRRLGSVRSHRRTQGVRTARMARVRRRPASDDDVERAQRSGWRPGRSHSGDLGESTFVVGATLPPRVYGRKCPCVGE